MHFLLNGSDISASPVEFHVNPAAALGSKSKIYPPPEPPVIQQPCNLMLEAIDKFGNKLCVGCSRSLDLWVISPCLASHASC